MILFSVKNFVHNCFELHSHYILKFIYLKKVDKEQLKRAALEAIEQIKEKQYDVNLKEKVVYIILAHHAKEAELI